MNNQKILDFLSQPKVRFGLGRPRNPSDYHGSVSLSLDKFRNEVEFYSDDFYLDVKESDLKFELSDNGEHYKFYVEGKHEWNLYDPYRVSHEYLEFPS